MIVTLRLALVCAIAVGFLFEIESVQRERFNVKNTVLATVTAFTILCAGCRNYAEVTELPYRGPAECKGEGGMVGNRGGIPVWSGGAPARRYKVLEVIEFTWIENGTRAAMTQSKEAIDEINRIASSKGADAMIVTGGASKVVGHKQSLAIKSHKQYFQLIKFLE